MHLNLQKEKIEKEKKQETTLQKFFQLLWILRRSLIHQTHEFFENSTLHGVRYIAENGRPTREKLMWFGFTTSGAVAALVIIMSLWEKFQTNPTITGLDTEFHEHNIIFPSVGFCPKKPFNHKAAYQTAYNYFAQYDIENAKLMAPFLESLTSLSFASLNETKNLAKLIPKSQLDEKSLREWAFEVRIQCEDVLVECKYRDQIIDCCSTFKLVYTEHGFCFVFNSRYESTEKGDIKVDKQYVLHETDKKWALKFIPKEMENARIFVFDSNEYFGFDFKSQIDWGKGQHVEMRISKQSTYTTDDARQLSIAQRKCIFHDEMQLNYFNEEYTFSSCMKECRIKNSIKLCKCSPPFYKPTNIQVCTVEDFPCLVKFQENITRLRTCPHCQLGCSKTVYNTEKLSKSFEATAEFSVLVELLSWPMVRYKREVLFGWVDLLVSFGGIASLFLGFSLLSGVEIIFYFTLRAFCMIYMNRDELNRMEEEIRNKPPPMIDMSLKPKFRNNSSEERNINVPILKRKSIKDYSVFANALYKTPTISAPKYGSNEKSQQSYGHYIP